MKNVGLVLLGVFIDFSFDRFLEVFILVELFSDEAKNELILVFYFLSSVRDRFPHALDNSSCFF